MQCGKCGEELVRRSCDPKEFLNNHADDAFFFASLGSEHVHFENDCFAIVLHRKSGMTFRKEVEYRDLYSYFDINNIYHKIYSY